MTTKNLSLSPSFSYCRRPHQWSYDVFLSFRGEDTRKNFTDHLYNALLQAGIHAFRDDKHLSRGNHISSELLKAIQESKVSIVVFSKGYASSRWCLDELVKIMQCKNTAGQIVVPIFYDVSPSDVRKQTGSFAEALQRHEQFSEREKVNDWRNALLEAANLSGWDLQNVANGHESKNIRKVVEDVLSKLSRNCLNVAKHPVGIDSRIKDVIVLLSVGTKDVRMIGIHGMGGIGKTTIAKAVFNQLCDGFEVRCFLSNVKEISEQPNGLIQLQEQLLRAVLKPKSLQIGSVDRGINMIRERFRHKRLLVVIDDLDHMKQFNALMGDRTWFGLGSRLIITSRDEHLLAQLEVDEKYQVKELDHNESLELFSWHAFRKTHPVGDYVELSNGVVDYGGGLPLALEVLGSYLCKRSIPEWTSALRKLKRIPHHQIQRKLRLSFDTLDDDKVKDIFLDIACFFIGTDRDYAVKILDGCGFFPEIGISVLIQRSLVTVDSKNKLSMHDLLRDMGREIVRELSPNQPGKRSRLWFQEDVLDVLSNQKVLNKLQILNLSHSEYLAKTPNFTCLTSLERLELEGCKNLVEIHQSVGHLDRLVFLNLEECKSLKNLPESVCCLKSLETLNISYCSKLEKLPEYLGKMESLTEILEYGTAIKLLPYSIGDLKKLRNVSLGVLKDTSPRSWFSSISSWLSPRNPNSKSLLLPASFVCLSSLQSLALCHCNLTEDSIPSLENLSSLQYLDLKGNKFSRLPTGIHSLTKLDRLCLNSCTNIVSISELPPSLKVLYAYNCISLEKLSIQSKEAPLLHLPYRQKQVQIQGLENVKNQPIIHMECCNSLPNQYQENFLQVLPLHVFFFIFII
ncbi:disease resistance protein RUN1 [Ricinus communis]|uniref:disease resistance protein RUN1 n=1 Tax=Ricinus communis TaxID=3988 RepID=UPI00201A69E0|nr:disease resistance protein RUN1 [Ricinus communis]